MLYQGNRCQILKKLYIDQSTSPKGKQIEDFCHYDSLLT